MEFERAYRLARVLRGIGEHPWLRERLVLKGGTCINFFYDDLPRLSVDMDLNYVGSLDRDTMVAERDEVEAELGALTHSLGYEWDPRPRSHAHRKLRFRYTNVHGHRDSIRADINYLMRLSLYGFLEHDLPEVFELDAAHVPALRAEEVYGGKLKALVARGHPRDLFDAARLFDGHVHPDDRMLRAAFLFHCHMDDATLDLVDLDHTRAVTDDDLATHLHPMLRAQGVPTARDLQAAVLPRVEAMLERSDDEIKYGLELERGRHEPDLLFGDIPVADGIDRHPAALWRAMHPHGKRDGREGAPE